MLFLWPASWCTRSNPKGLARQTGLLPRLHRPWASPQRLSGWWSEAPDSAAPDSSRTGLNEQVFIEPLLGPAAQGPAGRGPSCRYAQSQPRAGCTGCGRQLLGRSGLGALTSGPLGVTAFPHVGCPYPSQDPGVQRVSRFNRVLIPPLSLGLEFDLCPKAITFRVLCQLERLGVRNSGTLHPASVRAQIRGCSCSVISDSLLSRGL